MRHARPRIARGYCRGFLLRCFAAIVVYKRIAQETIKKGQHLAKALRIFVRPPIKSLLALAEKQLPRRDTRVHRNLTVNNFAILIHRHSQLRQLRYSVFL